MDNSTFYQKSTKWESQVDPFAVQSTIQQQLSANLWMNTLNIMSPTQSHISGIHKTSSVKSPNLDLSKGKHPSNFIVHYKCMQLTTSDGRFAMVNSFATFSIFCKFTPRVEKLPSHKREILFSNYLQVADKTTLQCQFL